MQTESGTSTGKGEWQVWPGYPFPLGATYDGHGTNFSLFSEVAQRVTLCLFDAQGKETQVDLPEETAYCWHGYLPDVEPGQRYGYRVHGPWDPNAGHRCNPAKLLIDPYAKAIDGTVQWDRSIFPYRGDGGMEADETDSAANVPKCVVVNPYFDWSRERKPSVSLHETVIYEVNIKGFTARHPDVPLADRGTYAGLAHPAVIDYLRDLGVTAVELMPVHHFVHDHNLVEKGLSNYWGYNTLGYFAPHAGYVGPRDLGKQVQEFKQMVLRLHEADIEVILDVVYNHTAEGNHQGPMLSFKGIDNVAYYRLVDDEPRYYMDYTGTGNTLNMRHPHVLQMVMDSLRYWVTEMHVDGFRFDLAATLARMLHDVDRLSSFFSIIQQDPVISQTKLIAEPWDVGEGGYQVGKFPPQWSEWNGKYRDCVRDFWNGRDCTLGEFARRFTGSSDLYEHTGRRPLASVNFVTAHDGFTLNDLVSYDDKHNDANQEEGRDGSDDNRSWNCGVEGPTDDLQVRALRDRQKRNFLTTLLLSQGLPMLLGGDELGRTQQGNNNAYCQDNEISWVDWEHLDDDLLEFTRMLVRLRRKHPVFRRWNWFEGMRSTGECEDISWWLPDGSPVPREAWDDHGQRTVQIAFSGQLNIMDTRGHPVVDDDFLVLINGAQAPVVFAPTLGCIDRPWEMVVNTSHHRMPAEPAIYQPGEHIPVESRSICVLRNARPDGAHA